MNKDELYNALETLADKNATTNTIAASILYTLAGLVALEKEDMLAIFTRQINEFYTQKNKQ